MQLRQTLRGLWRSAPTSGVVILSLSVGVGAVASVWATAAAILWAPLPLPEPHSLTALYEMDADGRRRGVALENLLDLERAESTVSMAAYRPRSYGLRRANEKTRVVQVGLVTEAFFRTLGVVPVEGRDFEGADEPGVIIVSEGLGEPGDVLLLNEEPRTVVGVVPSAFRFPMSGVVPVAFIPLSHADYGGKRSVRTLDAVVRLAKDRTLADAEAELRAIAARLQTSFPDTNAEFSVSLVNLKEALTSRNADPVKLLGAVAISLILIVTVNLMNVFLARRATRASELSVRRTLGARASDLFALLFTENAVLGLTGGALGLLFASALLELVPTLVDHLGGGPVEPPILGRGAILLALGLGVALAAIFALPFETRRRSRQGLIVAQVALGLLLVQATVLLGRSFLHLTAVDPGFRTERIVTFGLGLPEAVYDSGEALLDFHRRLLAELDSIPGVISTGTAAGGGLLAGRLPLNVSFRPEGDPAPRRDWPSVSARIATPGYFETLDVPILRGRPLRWTDDAEHPRVVLVNRAFEETHMRDGAVGRRVELSWFTGEPVEIIGVLADVRQIDLATEAAPEIVMSMSQTPAEYGIYVLRVEGMDPAVFTAARDTVSRLDGRLQTVRVREAREWIATSLAGERLTFTLVAALSVTALILASIGIHGLLLATVLGRRRELAIRLALGAEPASIQRLVAREGLTLVAVGTLLGAAAFVLTVPWLRSLLSAAEPFDLASTVTTLALLVVVAALACASPARRAGRTPVGEALRAE